MLDRMMEFWEKEKKSAQFIAAHPIFDHIILGFILLNALFQALEDPTSEEPAQYQTVAEWIFTLVFTLELLLKNLAWGPRKYLKDPWNWLDAVVVTEGLFSLIGTGNDLSFSALRTLRILRPLRTIKRFPGLQKIVLAILNAVKNLSYITMVFLLFLVMSSIFGVVIWSGKLSYRCKDGTDWLDVESYDSVGILCGNTVVEQDKVCQAFSLLDQPYTCEGSATCEDSGIVPYGVVSFDDCLRAMLTFFQIFTLDSWNEILFYTQMVSTQGTVLIYVFLIFVGTYTIVNMMIAAILSEFQSVADTSKEVEKEEEAGLLKYLHRVTFRLKQNLSSRALITHSSLRNRCPLTRMRPRHLAHCHFLKVLCEDDKSWLNRLIYACIYVNVMVLAIDFHGAPTGYTTALEGLNTFFTILFAIEVAFKMVVLNPFWYLSHWSNVMDTLIVIGSLVELGLAHVDLGGTATLFRMVRIFRLFRVLRLAKVSSKWEPVVQALQTIVKSSQGILPAFLLLCLVWFIFAILGMTLFGAATADLDERFRFDSFGWAFFQVFFVSTGDNWAQVMYTVVHATSSLSSSFYFIALVIVAYYVLLNLILAVILDGSMGAMSTKLQNQRKLFKLQSISTKQALRGCLYQWMEAVEIRRNNQFLNHIRSTGTVWSVEQFQIQDIKINSVRSRSITTSEQSKRYSLNPTAVNLPPSGFRNWADSSRREESLSFTNKLLGIPDTCFVPTSMQKRLQSLCHDSRYHNFMIVVILVSTGLSFLDENQHRGTAFLCLEVLCVFFFILESVLMSIAHTFRRATDAYIRSIWHQIDVFLIFVSLVYIFAFVGGADTATLRVIAVFKSLRPLRLGARMKSFTDFMKTVAGSFQGLGTVGSFIILMWFGYSIMGMQLFKGTFYYCTDPDFPEGAYRYGKQDEQGTWLSPPCHGVWVNSTTGLEEYREYEWVNADFNFDNVFQSMWCMFLLMTVENWMEVLWQAVDSTQVDYQPQTNSNQSAFLFFFFGVFIFGFYLTNLFIGVVFETYCTMQSMSHGYLIDAETRRKEDYLHHLSKKKTKTPILPPRHKWRRFFYRLVQHQNQERPAFERVVMFVLVCNTITLLTEHSGESSTLSQMQTILNDIFAVLFVLEATLLLTGIGPAAYFGSTKHTFDFVITIVSIGDSIVSSWMNSCSDTSSNLVAVIRALRIVRVVRLGYYIPGLRYGLKIAGYPMGHLGSIGFLMAVVLFTFANFGVLLFGDAVYDTTSNLRYANFSNRWSAMTLLFIVMTGEAWTDFTVGLSDDAMLPQWVLKFYFFIFVVMMTFLLVNFFVIVVAADFEILGNSERREFEKHIPRFQKVWLDRIDQQGTGKKASPAQVHELYLLLPPPIGLGKHASFVAVDWRVNRMVDSIDMNASCSWAYGDVLKNMYMLSAFQPAEIILADTLYLAMVKAFKIVQIYRWLAPAVRRWQRHKAETRIIKMLVEDIVEECIEQSTGGGVVTVCI